MPSQIAGMGAAKQVKNEAPVPASQPAQKKGCEDENKCCIFVPIKTGFKLLGAFYICDTISAVLFAILILTNSLPGDWSTTLKDPAYFGAISFATACELFSSLLFFRWMREDTKATREGLKLAILVSIVCSLACGILSGFYAVWVGILICIYFHFVAKRFSLQPIE